MILVDTLSIIHPAIQLRYIVLCEANNSLNIYEDVECKPETRVCGCEVFVSRPRLVHLNNNQARGKGCCAKDVKEEVGERA